MSNIASREILWNVSSLPNVIAMYLLFAISLFILSWGVWSRIRLWRSGKKIDFPLNNILERTQLFLENVLFQKKVTRERTPAIFHTLIYTGFLVLLFTTTMVFIDHDLGIKIYQGPFYLFVTILSDCFGVFLLIGLAIAYHRRYLNRPDFIHISTTDKFLLGSLTALVLQGYILEGLRIHATNDPWMLYSPVGYLTSLLFWGFSENSSRVLHFLIWWFHSITVFTFIALIPYTKFFHLVSSSANLILKNTSRPKGALSFPGDVEKILEEASNSDSGEFSFGVSKLADLNWKQLLELDACTSCGRCQDVCPAYNSGKVLSPKWLILDTRDHMLTLHTKQQDTNPLNQIDRSLINNFLLSGRPKNQNRASNLLVQESALQIGDSSEAMLAGGVMQEDVFWSCTTCRACVEVCPVGINHVDLITDVRRNLTLVQGTLPSEANSSLRAIETRGNPFGPAEDRTNWCSGLNIPFLSAGDEVEVLYWVGCLPAYDKRKQKIAQSFVKILNESGVKWGILGKQEQCSGDPARRLGEENLYQTVAKNNIETLLSIKFDKIVATCPHCFNTLKNEYPQLNERFNQIPVIHHTQFIDTLIKSGKIAVKEQSSEVTYHDPCYLGRYNDTFDEPRDVLVQITRGVREMKSSKEKGLCCGAGGGHFWMDLKVGERVNVQRAEQAIETGAKTIATACPFCLHMLEDGLKLKGEDENIKVQDIAELVAANLVIDSSYEPNP
jgi:Fe-S oxidoreductase/nitrate reductase gamma subunit